MRPNPVNLHTNRNCCITIHKYVLKLKMSSSLERIIHAECECLSQHVNLQLISYRLINVLSVQSETLSFSWLISKLSVTSLWPCLISWGAADVSRICWPLTSLPAAKAAPLCRRLLMQSTKSPKISAASEDPTRPTVSQNSLHRLKIK